MITALAISAAFVGLLPATPAFATKSADTAAAAKQAQAKLDALNVKADQAVEAYDLAQSKLDAATKQVAAQQAAVAKAQQRLDVARAGLQEMAVAEYERGATSTTLAYALSDDPAKLLQRAALLSQISRTQAASLTVVVNADRAMQSAKAQADQALATQKAAAASVAASKDAAEKTVAAQQAVLNTLQTKYKQEVAAEQAQAAAAARAEAARQAQLRQEAAARSYARSNLDSSGAGSAPSGPAPAPPAPAPPVAHGGVSAVLAYAYAQLGKPYRFGGAGPNSFDCSGLTMRAWQAAGVSLSHSSSAQQHEGRRVSMSALQPGDLIFWGNPAYHVAIYIGGGKIIAAPHTGTVVQIQSIWGHPSMAVRP